MHKVILTYFKQSGKYYSEGTYESDCEAIHNIWDEVEAFNKSGTLPGLCKGSSGWIILVNVPGHPHDHPRLIL